MYKVYVLPSAILKSQLGIYHQSVIRNSTSNFTTRGTQPFYITTYQQSVSGSYEKGGASRLLPVTHVS